MNVKKLPREKRNHLILVALLTVTALVGIGLGLIRFQYADLRSLSQETADAAKQLTRMKESIQHADEIEGQVNGLSKHLATVEAEMGAGDLYSWGLDVLRRFRAAYSVDVPAIAQPVQGPMTLLPNFPYKQATFSLGGSGYYHDLGRFIADFENQFPHLRIVNLTLDPASSLLTAEKEKLEFKMDVVALIRPNQN